ncbi:MAG TPA: DUF3140 domain-containing protein [Pseudonocardiaceae bacterium]|nr:DUF3140 domain-containing protein [Pseudonocardiaceae bacterium]
MNDHEKKRTREEFSDAVNMTAGELRDWLASGESKSVGDTTGKRAESTGHTSGRHIVTVLRTNRRDLTDKQYNHMRKVIGYVHRHLAQRPDGDITDSRWRYSLMNWDQDPCKEQP